VHVRNDILYHSNLNTYFILLFRRSDREIEKMRSFSFHSLFY